MFQGDKEHFPHMYSIALDVMPVQASAVACERVFSSSKETDALRRRCTAPSFFEILQRFKFSIKKARLYELTWAHFDGEEDLKPFQLSNTRTLAGLLDFLDDPEYHSDDDADDLADSDVDSDSHHSGSGDEGDI